MADASSTMPYRQSSPIFSGSPAILSSTVAHPSVTHLNAECIRAFLPKYDWYVNEVRARDEYLVGDTSTSRPAALKFCIDS